MSHAGKRSNALALVARSTNISAVLVIRRASGLDRLNSERENATGSCLTDDMWGVTMGVTFFALH